jgi:hypothetical protein
MQIKVVVKWQELKMWTLQANETEKLKVWRITSSNRISAEIKQED